jgi:hypothetical protein
MTASGAGTVLIVGAGAVTLGAMTFTGAGAVGDQPVLGELAQTLGAMTASGAGAVLAAGSAAPRRPAECWMTSSSAAWSGVKKYWFQQYCK